MEAMGRSIAAENSAGAGAVGVNVRTRMSKANRMPKSAIKGKAAAPGSIGFALGLVSNLAAGLLLAIVCGMAACAPATALRAEEAARGGEASRQVRPEQPARPTASAVKLEASGDRAKLTFELSETVDAMAFALARPDRIIVDLPQVDFALDPEIGKAAPRRSRRKARRAKPASLVASYRFGQLEQGKSRIVIDLAAPARILRVGCEAGDGKARLVIELAKTDRAEFRASVQAARAALAAQAQARQVRKFDAPPGKPVVIIDPGHGGIDGGARANGLVEKDLVFAFAQAVAAKLEAGGRYTTIMTRTDDSFVALSDRVKMARSAKAALFVSIHADTLSDAAHVAGATVYTVSDRASDKEAARVAEKENQSDAAAGLDRAEDAGDVSDILFDLTRRETRAYSHYFARTLVNYWKVAGRLNKNPQRSAGFRVLKAPDVPSVLLELGYLSNEKDDFSLTSVEWRERASGRVVEAIEAFFSARGSDPSSASMGADQSTPAPSIPGKGGPNEGDALDGAAALEAPIGDVAGKSN